MDPGTKPNLKTAKESLPESLVEVLISLFSRNPEGCVLAGGTALSGFYTGHRRSDDIDLFVEDDMSFKNLVLSVKSIANELTGFQLRKERTSLFLYHASCEYRGHSFTIDIVLDPHLFEIGSFGRTEEGVVVADLKTLLKLKAATLVSRCSEKDLSDLIQLFDVFSNLALEKIIDQGREVDAGVHAESMLASLAGASLKLEACDFSLKGQSPKEIFDDIKNFQKQLIQALRIHLKNEALPPIGKLIRMANKAARE